VLKTVLNPINNEFEYKRRDEVVRLLYTHLNSQTTNDCNLDEKYSIQGLPRTIFPEHQVWAIRFNVGSYVWHFNMLGALVADDKVVGKTFTSVAAAILCNLVAEKGVMGLQLSIMKGNTLQKWDSLALNDLPAIIGENQKYYLFGRQNSVPYHHSQIQLTPPHGIQHVHHSLKLSW
jgi:hypothetical protein